MAELFSVELVEHWHKFIAAKVASGAFESAQELLTSALCMLEEQEERIDQLTEALEAGERSGDFGPWDLKEFLDEMHQSAGTREAA